jgi:hypothetical protein
VELRRVARRPSPVFALGRGGDLGFAQVYGRFGLIVRLRYGR